ncbi:LysM domain-containing protein [Rheinheimera sp. 1928-s]|uniref:LysM peptidoglycan-binding domain-containing protein n=1 Tax=Rheinheimera sp. 1928-s TaxID=3033803 RepID=UPI00262A494F|nr:LysM domain-containing protein [Rheinheimera sp. 1928-s]MDF3125454.1 LysM domain-containing protein [Rheinheimera sp. 1928-s]
MRQQLLAILVSFSVFFSTILLADELKLKADAPTLYQVKAGDTLWDIAGLYLQHPWLWPRLWKLNPQVNNPHLIYPGDQLHLQFDADGQPILRLNSQRATASSSEVTQAQSNTSAAGAIKLTPQIRRIAKADKPVPSIALASIEPFLSEERLVSEDQLESLPYVLGGKDNVKNAVSGHLLYVQGELDQAQRYGIYRQGEVYEDPQSGDVLGYEAILMAEAKVLPSVMVDEQQISRIEVQKSRREVRQGDRLLPMPQQSVYPDFFQLQSPDTVVSGVIVDSASQWREFAKGEIVLLNQGQNAQLQPGHLLGIFRQSPSVVDFGDKPSYPEDSEKLQRILHEVVDSADEMPTELVGQLMIVKVDELSSFAMILRTEQPVRVGDLIGNL